MREMKDSGVEWIGEVPANWDVRRVKQCLCFLDYLRAPIEASMRSVSGTILYPYYGASGIIDAIDDYNVEGSSLLVGEDGANLSYRNLPLVYFATGKYWVNNHAHILRPLFGDIRYYFYTLESCDYTCHITGSTQPKLTQQNLSNVSIPVPPETEQRRIVFYLDERCAIIDDDIAKHREVIGKLKEYKKSLIAHAVTKGIDLNAEMKDSGVEWIGKIPASWEIVPIKADVSIGHGSDPTLPGDIPVWGSGSEPFKTCGEFKEGPTVLLGRKGTLDRPQLVMGRYWNVDTAFDAKVATSKLLLKFFYYVATCVDIKPYMTNTAKPSMTQFDWGNSKIPRPPLSEQRHIVSYLDNRCADIDEAISRQEQLIEKLGEYRRSIIHHAVTGKTDCTEA